MNMCANNCGICQAVDLKVMGVQYSTKWMGSPC